MDAQLTICGDEKSSPPLKIAVPIIDISGCADASSAERLRLGKTIDAAVRSVGFFSITGHGVSPELIARMENLSREFFDLPVEVKDRYRRQQSNLFRGYFGIGGISESHAQGKAAPRDFTEKFITCREPTDMSDPYYQTEAGRRIFAPNNWPSEVPGFRATSQEYYGRMSALAQTLMRLFALGLDLPETWFDKRTDKHMSTLTLANYPAPVDEPPAGQLRQSPHSDISAFTILQAEDKPGGLEVRDSDGIWHTAPIVPNAFLINIGDLIARWTNDRWVSNVHRVVMPPRDQAAVSRRQSIAFFLHPNYDGVVECIPSCLDGRPAKYPPVTVGEYMSMRMAKSQVDPSAS
jgi:isopenicillin N synthase-like dioxygenase